MSASVDGPLMLFFASISICVGSLLIVNRVGSARRNAAAVREMQDVYGRDISERVSRSSTPKHFAFIGAFFIFFGVVSLVILAFKFHVPYSVISVAGASFLSAGQLISAGVLLVGLLRRRPRQESRVGMAKPIRSVINVLILLSCGLLTFFALVLLIIMK